MVAKDLRRFVFFKYPQLLYIRNEGGWVFFSIFVDAVAVIRVGWMDFQRRDTVPGIWYQVQHQSCGSKTLPVPVPVPSLLACWLACEPR